LDSLFDRGVEIGIIEDDVGRLAAEFLVTRLTVGAAAAPPLFRPVLSQ